MVVVMNNIQKLIRYAAFFFFSTYLVTRGVSNGSVLNEDFKSTSDFF